MKKGTTAQTSAVTWPRSHSGKVARIQTQAPGFHAQSSAHSLDLQWGTLLGKESARPPSLAPQDPQNLLFQPVWCTPPVSPRRLLTLLTPGQNLTWAISAAISRASSLLTGNLPATISPLVWEASSRRSRSVSPLTWLRKYSLQGREWEARAQLGSQTDEAVSASVYLDLQRKKETTLFIPSVSLFSTASRKT